MSNVTSNFFTAHSREDTCNALDTIVQREY